jgi:hypothetical protein
LVTVVSCDNANNNLYHQRLTQETRPEYMHALDVDNFIRVSSHENSPAQSVIDIPSHETRHSSIADSLHSVVSML